MRAPVMQGGRKMAHGVCVGIFPFKVVYRLWRQRKCHEARVRKRVGGIENDWASV
jgi:hypothetical protein